MPHTQGEWGYDPNTHHVVSITAFEEWCHGLVDEDEAPIPKRVFCTIGAMGGDDVHADLALIIAAPKLLAACKEMLDAASWTQKLVARQKVKDAVAQAQSWDLTPKLQEK